MQVDPLNPKSKPPETEHVKPIYGILLSTLAFKFNLRRHIKVVRYALQLQPRLKTTRSLEKFRNEVGL